MKTLLSLLITHRNISLRRVHLISYCDSPIRFFFPETTAPYVTITFRRKVSLSFILELSKILLFQVFKPQYKS